MSLNSLIIHDLDENIIAQKGAQNINRMCGTVIETAHEITECAFNRCDK